MSALTPLLLDYDNAAALLGMTRPALRDLVYRRRGPATVKVGRRTLFAYRDLEAWVEAQRLPAPPPASADLPKRKRGRPSIADKIARGEI
ncbi:MAG: helix-turn-helix transcriptional regulator [Rhizobiaceae bacterium]